MYLSVGSAVMSPMIFEKSFSMAQNMAQQHGAPISSHLIAVADLAESRWNWKRDGEPPPDRPEYYLRFFKTFNRMGGEAVYVAMDNRGFFRELEASLCKMGNGG